MMATTTDAVTKTILTYIKYIFFLEQNTKNLFKSTSVAD